VVHVSVDPTVPLSTKHNGEDEATDPDKVITNARCARDTDGLLNTAELIDFFGELPNLRSTYDRGTRTLDRNQRGQTFGERAGLNQANLGYFEPAYTS
jgi:RNA exonuclease NGL2